MKKTIQKLGLVGLLGLALAGCKEPREYIVEKPEIDNGPHTLVVKGYVDRKEVKFSKLYNWDFFEVDESTWRDYPSAGRTEPYAVVKEDSFGTHVTLHTPKKDNGLKWMKY